MSTDNTPQPEREMTDDEADRLTYESMRRDGRFVPQSPEEVAKAEAEIDEAAVELPPGLRDPLAILTNNAASETAAQPLAEPPSLRASSPKGKEKPARGTQFRKMIAWLVVVGTLTAVGGYQFFGWYGRSRDVREQERALQASQNKLARVEAEIE